MNSDIVGINLPMRCVIPMCLRCLSWGVSRCFQSDRGDSDPLVLGGGACTINPEPVADFFFDLFAVGDGEEVTRELIALYREHKRRGFRARHFAGCGTDRWDLCRLVRDSPS